MTSWTRRFSALLFAAAVALASACTGKPVDPLAEDRARLLALKNEPPPEDWPAEAALYAGPELVRSQLDAALRDLADSAAAAPPLQTPVGPMRTTPRMQVAAVTLAPSGACPACVEVEAKARGPVAIFWSTPLGQVDREVPLEVTATATLELALVREEDERVVELRAVEDGAWEVDASSPTLPPELAAAMSGVLGGHVERLVRAGLVPRLPLLRLADDDELPLRAVRARPVPDGNGGHVVAIELAFEVLEKGVLGRAPDPEDGFLLAVPERTLLGIARAGALRAEPADGYAPDPQRLSVDGDRFTLDLKVWKVQAKPVADTYQIRGRIRVEDGAVEIEAEEVELIDGAFDINPLALIERLAIIGHLQSELNAALPARVEEDVALGRRVAVDVVGAEGKDGALVVRGRVELLTPESS